ncbi:F-box/WD repeat-containing protein 8-like [Gigantopelta aegis]|uniref:F-box/WD repeat-containing protein 8-like n=1 Tax=Gigantopelta aegis TaxID=1735272 RepID=UPI001B88D382|nr:F-box/WD repeat-containing protein 8-like [Gigantopelta aegis]
MTDGNDLEKFRLQWKKELAKLNNHSGSQTIASQEKSVVPELAEDTHDSHTEVNAEQGNGCLEAGSSALDIPVSKSVLKTASVGLESETCDHCGKPLHKPQQRDGSDNRTIANQITPQVISYDQGYFPFVILDRFLKDGYHRYHSVSTRTNTKKRKYFEDEALVVHDGSKCSKSQQDKTACCMCSKSVTIHKKQDVDSNRDKERYLDIFIADLDEITEIPFFDTTVPRELGIKIFRHLDLKTLCRCSQVSRSWRSLAEDDLLWCRICRDLGYEKDMTPRSVTNWKQVVREYISRKKTLISNWKGRLGKITKLEYPHGGVVCSVHSCKELIVAGYSNGRVKLWDISSGIDCTFQPSSTALVIDASHEEGTIQNYVLRVTTSQLYTAAAYKHGFVDIWDNVHGTSAINTVRCEGSWQISGLEMMERRPWLALSQGYYVQIHHHSNSSHHYGNSSHYQASNNSDIQSGFVMTQKLDLNQMVKHIKWLETLNHHGNELCILAVATDSIVNVYRPEDGGDVPGTEIHNLYNAPISCIDLRSDPGYLAVACGLYGGPSESFRVKLYDLATKQLLSTLQGHTWIITCINLADSPPSCLITGNGDRRVRIYDLRSSSIPVTVFTGHSAKVSTVMMDDWKVVSGDEGGFVCVWDQRMSSKLWEWHNRHPVQYTHFHDGMLIVGNVPYEKFPDSDFETVPHRRLRGSVQVYDFSADVMIQGLPEICHSTYDEPEAYDFNIRLAVPYDKL